MIAIDLSGKHAVVTGGSSGIGSAVAKTLARAGATVTVLARQENHDDGTVDTSGDQRISFRELDVSDSHAVSSVYEQIAETVGMDIAIHSAGILTAGTLLETSDEQWRKQIAVNVDGVFFCTREALRHMVKRGRGGKVISIGSVSGLRGSPGFGAYCASKGAIISLTQQAAVDYAAAGINVNSVASGFVTTPMTSRYDEATKAYIASQIPSRTWATPQNIADAVLFLASSLSDYMHGQSIVVDGGWTAGCPM